MADPRVEVIDRRLSTIDRIIAVSSGKGGVGKSVVASTLALTLARRGLEVGLLDLDFTCPTTHLILGVEDGMPEEERGLLPPRVQGLEYLSLAYYTKDRPTPLRGGDISNAIVELLSITRWGQLALLVVDMPPGIGDATLDLLRLIPQMEFLVVTTPSHIAFETVRRLLGLLGGLRRRVVGVVENMVMNPSDFVEGEVEAMGFPYLGVIPFDPELEGTLGDVEALMETSFAEAVGRIASALLDEEAEGEGD
ncbi:MAG: PP-loop ATPase, mrp-like protein [Candidatus Bathyarchaeota archaeon B23]|nr:MAG: PP-loop ATPase, mrp-like protein [Candidatus Bathyarchaeota archaeon B23]